MNFIDRKFYEFVSIIKNYDVNSLYDFIKDKFLKLNIKNQEALINYLKKYPYWGKIDNANYEHIHKRASALREHIEDYVWLYEGLKDYRSKYVLLAVLNNYYQFDFISLTNASETIYPDYFDFDLIKLDKKQVIVDAGAYTGDTIISYINSFGIDSYDKIYAYEITPSVYEKLKENTEKYPKVVCKLNAVSDKEETLHFQNNINSDSANRITSDGEFSVEAITIDTDIKEKITMIKMDIEGAEQRALMGAREHIKKDKPTLLISVYHNFEDLYKIPRMIMEMNNNYEFYLRYNGKGLFPTEITLICIPTP